MKKEFKFFKFISDDPKRELKSVALPYQGNTDPINAMLNALSDDFRMELKNVVLPYQGNPGPICAAFDALKYPPLNCKTVVFEKEYVDFDYCDEYAAFYSRAFKKYPSRAVRLHFFSAELSDADIHKMGSFQKDYLGFLVLRPTDLQKVGRTILIPPLQHPDSEFIHCCAEFTAHILGQKLVVQGMPFIQQDTQVGSCAQASLWMFARYMSRHFGYREFFPAEINRFAKSKGAMGRVLPAERGLTMEQMLDALEAMGFSAWSYSREGLGDCAPHIDLAIPAPLKGESNHEKEAHQRILKTIKLADIAYRYIESGLPVIFCTQNHALVGIGHTYSHTEQVKAAIQRIPSFIVHNDAVGPYQSMPIHSQPTKGQRSFSEVEVIIAVVPSVVTLSGEDAESMSRNAVKRFLDLRTRPDFPTYKDLICALRPEFKGILDNLEYRTFLMPSVEFQSKLRCDKKSRHFNAELADRLIGFDYPMFLWITEVSSQSLLNHSNGEDRKCLGRILIDSTAPSSTRGEMVVHFADFLGLLDRQTGEIKPWEHVPKTTPFLHQIRS